MTAWGLLLLGATAVSTSYVVMDSKHADKMETTLKFHQNEERIDALAQNVNSLSLRQQLWEKQSILNSAEVNMYRLQDLSIEYPENQQIRQDYVRAQARVERLRQEYEASLNKMQPGQ